MLRREKCLLPWLVRSLEVFSVTQFVCRSENVLRFLKNIHLRPLINMKSNLQHFRCVSFYAGGNTTKQKHVYMTPTEKYHKTPTREKEKSPKRKINNFYVRNTHVQRWTEDSASFLAPSFPIKGGKRKKRISFFFQLLFMLLRWKKNVAALFLKLLARKLLFM